MQAEYDAAGLPTRAFRDYVDRFIEREWPGTMEERQRARATDEALQRRSDRERLRDRAAQTCAFISYD